MTGREPDAEYRARRERFSGEAERLNARSDALSNGRLFTFLAALVFLLGGAEAGPPYADPFRLVGLGLLGLFGALVFLDRGTRARARSLDALARVNAWASARAARDWDALRTAAPIPRGRPLPP